MDPIEVRISREDMCSASATSGTIFSRLKSAGVPVRGRHILDLLIYTIDHGVLDRTEDFETGDLLFRWKDD